MDVIRLCPEMVEKLWEKTGMTRGDLEQMNAQGVAQQTTYLFVFPDEQWVPGLAWRVTDAFGKHVAVSSNPDELRKLMMDGYKLEQEYVNAPKSKWVEVE